MLTSRLLLIVGLTAVAFSPALVGTFHFDDYYMLNDPIVQSPSGWWEVFRLARTRPLTYLTFWLNYQLGGENPIGYLALNLLLHLGVVWAAWRVFPRVVSPQAALYAVALLAVHPIQSEPVNYVYARATILTTLFCSLSWRAWINRRFDRSAAYFALALLAKEEAAALPVFLAGYELIYRKWGGAACRAREKLGTVPSADQGSSAPNSTSIGTPRTVPNFSPSLRTWLRPWLAMIALCGLAAARLLYAASVTKGAGLLYDLGEVTPLNYLATQGRTFWLYLRLVFLPIGLNFDHDFALTRGPDLSTIASWTALLALVAFAAVMVRKEPTWFWLLGAVVLLLPTSSIAPLADLVAERRVYLPLISAALGIGVLIAKAPRPVGVIILLAAAGLSAQRSFVFRTEESLWRDTVQKSPNKVRPKLQLARALGNAEPPGKEEQLRLLQQARQLAPADPDVAAELGVYYLQAGQPREALPHFTQALKETDRAPAALTNWGAAELMLGARQEAVAAFQEALEKDRCQFDARNNLIYIYRQAGQRDKAQAAATPPSDCRFPEQQRQALATTRRELSP